MFQYKGGECLNKDDRLWVGETLKKARKNAGLTQAQVADLLGLTYQAISNYERGINSIDNDTLMKLCLMYNIPPFGVKDTTVRDSIAGKIKSARETAGLSQTKTASLAGISMHRLRGFENSEIEIDPETLRKLCDIYGTKVSSIVEKKQVYSYSAAFKAFSDDDAKDHIEDLKETIARIESLICNDDNFAITKHGTANNAPRMFEVHFYVQVFEDFGAEDYWTKLTDMEPT